MQNPITIKIGGESGQGINSIGEAVAKSFKESGFYTFGYREYPSLIRGGYASYQLEVFNQPVNCPHAKCDLLACLSRRSFHEYLRDVRDGGTIIHTIARLDIKPEEKDWIEQHQLQVEYVDAARLAVESGGKRLMSNTVLVGLLWNIFQLPIDQPEHVIREVFAHKPHYIDVNVACLHTGYNQQLKIKQQFSFTKSEDNIPPNAALISGNQALALGAVAAGVRTYFAYPMTPSSSILAYLASIQHETGMIVKQVDDEIAAAQMAIGSMFMGTRSLTGTSGGGFDLMTESVSLTGITETPFVCVIAQRPGPATGLPTWTSAADLMLAVYGGHGEFARVVIAASDARSAYSTVQHAFNIAESFQVPVLLLTEKQIAESIFTLDQFDPDPEIQRGLAENLEDLKPKDRYKFTDSGVSPRWIPGSAHATYDANSDEHLEDGSLTEEAVAAKKMYDKRLRKESAILNELPEPQLYGPAHADITLVGWGSVKPTVLDALAHLGTQSVSSAVNYLHYEYLYPLKTEKIHQLVDTGNKMVLIENNATGQLGKLIAQETGFLFQEKILKYDGRPFFVEEVVSEINTHIGKNHQGTT